MLIFSHFLRELEIHSYTNWVKIHADLASRVSCMCIGSIKMCGPSLETLRSSLDTDRSSLDTDTCSLYIHRFSPQTC